jgi:hypothetical protein
VREFDSYLCANTGRIPNYGERRRAGETISTAFTESAVNQVISKRMVKKQQMRWTPHGAHLLLQVRTRGQDQESRRLPRPKTRRNHRDHHHPQNPTPPTPTSKITLKQGH